MLTSKTYIFKEHSTNNILTNRIKAIAASIFCILMSSCSSHDENKLNESAIRDLSKQTIDLSVSNNKYYYPTVKKRIQNQENSELYSLIVEAAITIDTLVVEYVMKNGGASPNDRSMLQATFRGQQGLELYENHQLNQKLSSILEKINKYQSSNKDVENLKEVMNSTFDHYFIGGTPYFNKEKLVSNPFSIIALELAIVEHHLYTILLLHISENDISLLYPTKIVD
jgi:hypothetical protein